VKPGEILSNVLGAVAVGLLGFICHVILRAYRKFDQFMAEHMWLLATTLWTRDKVMEIMGMLGIEVQIPPPANMPKGKHHAESK